MKAARMKAETMSTDDAEARGYDLLAVLFACAEALADLRSIETGDHPVHYEMASAKADAALSRLAGVP